MPTVIVGCKLPNGIILEHAGKRVTLNGGHSAKIRGSHGLTQVDKDFWDAWRALHADYHPVKKGLIFAHEKEVNTQAEGREKEKLATGLEGIDPNKPGKGIEPGKTS